MRGEKGRRGGEKGRRREGEKEIRGRGRWRKMEDSEREGEEKES